jgi:integrase
MGAATPKSHQSRTVPIPILGRVIAGAIIGKDADDLAFTTSSGGVLRLPEWERDAFTPLRARAGLGDRFRVHDLRHTAASLMIQAGHPPNP